jgi:hypothetical protein
MAIDPQTVRPQTLVTLRELLKTCSAQLVGVDGTLGTGFFVDERLLLTCAHVVQGSEGDPVEVRPFGRPPRGGLITAVQPKLEIDLALVEVELVDGEDVQPAVALHRDLTDHIDYFAVGYPKEELLGKSGLEEIGYRGHQRLDDPETADFLVLEAGGAVIGSGLSGGPLLHSETGAVVGIVQYAQVPGGNSGGAAIPVARAAAEFEQIEKLIADPPTSARRWRDALGQEAWEALGKPWGWRRSHDIVLSGELNAWKVWIDPDDASKQELTVRNLPDQVSEALFQWAQRRRARREPEVKMLGKLLAAAVFPDAVAAHIWRDRQADNLRIRLRVEGDSDLFDVPWEFVTMPTKTGDRHIAAEEGFGLVRTAAHATPQKVDVRAAQGEAGVLAMVVQPRLWQERMPSFVYTGKTVAWPEEDAIMARLRETIDGVSGFRCLLKEQAPLANPSRWLFETALEQPRPEGVSLEVVHYVGFGHVEDGVAKLGFSDDEGDVEWHPLDQFLDKVAESGARVLVVELALPRFDMELETFSPRAFLRGLSNRLNAVVFTRFPVHPRQFQMFNSALYRELGVGRSIESAVQQARWQLYRSPALDDAAGFGWFTLVTGPTANMRLLPQRTGAPKRGMKQEAAPPDEQRPGAPAEVQLEGFVRGPS